MDPKLMLAKRCIKFINNATNSSNNIVKTISNMGLYSSCSIMGANVRHLEALYSTQVSNVQKTWTAIGAALTDAIRLCTPIKGLIEIRDSYVAEHLSYSDCKIMIDYLCIPEYWNCIYMFGLLVNLESAICMTNKELLTYLLTISVTECCVSYSQPSWTNVAIQMVPAIHSMLCTILCILFEFLFTCHAAVCGNSCSAKRLRLTFGQQKSTKTKH